MRSSLLVWGVLTVEEGATKKSCIVRREGRISQKKVAIIREGTHKKVFFSGRTTKVWVPPLPLDLSGSYFIVNTLMKKGVFFLVVRGV